MAIQGYYLSRSNPLSPLYVETTVRLTRLGVQDTVDFLIDTGADMTCLHPQDAARLGVSYDRIQPMGSVTSVGVGGPLEYYREEATLIFRDQDDTELLFYCHIHISLSPAVAELPSLLGRDFLNRCSLLADNPENQVLITPANTISGVILPA